MNAIKNFLRPTKVTKWVFTIFFFIFVIVPFLGSFFGCMHGCYISDVLYEVQLFPILMFLDISSVPFFIILLIYTSALGSLVDRFPAGVDSGMVFPEPNLLGYVLIIVTLALIFWIISSVTAKVWYSFKKQQQQTF